MHQRVLLYAKKQPNHNNVFFAITDQCSIDTGKYNDYHQSGLAAVFINLSDLFPCSASEQSICYKATREEDGFNKGKAILEAADGGNNFKVWPNGQKRTYGFAIEGCEELGSACLPAWYQFTIVCHLPRPLCG